MKPAHEIIKDLTIKTGISQKKLAEEVGMTQQAIALIENGKRKVEFDLFVKIMDYFKEPLCDIFINGGLLEKDLESNLSTKVCFDFEDSFNRILKSHGAFIFFDNDDNYILKYDNKQKTLSEKEYLNLRDDIGRYIEFRLQQIVESKE